MKIRNFDPHDNLCQNLQRLLDRFCPGPRVTVRFSRPEPKTLDDSLRAELAALLRAGQPAPHGGHTMASFETQIDDTQKVLATFGLAKADGSVVPITGLVLTQLQGDATFSMTGDDGLPLPVEQVFLISGPTDGQSVWDVSIQNDIRPTMATLILDVIAGVISVSVVFAVPEPK